MTTDAAVQAALDIFHTTPTTSEATVSYESSGRLLIIAKTSQVIPLLDTLPDALQPTLLCTEQCGSELDARLSNADIPYLDNVKNVQISGFLGQFHANADYQIQAHRRIDKKNFLPEYKLTEVVFDLVVDLQKIPAISSTIAPPGYFSLSANNQDFNKIIEDLPEWIGVFDKPKYFGFLSERCAHSANSIVGCKQCIDHCPTDAITSINGQITIEPGLCQGCGDCATTCPAGAMVYRYPSVKTIQNQLRLGLHAFYQAGGSRPVLLFYNQESSSNWLVQNNHLLPPETIPCAVESLTAYGLDTWLAALIYGASSILLLSTENDLPVSAQLLDQQISILDTLLQGIGITECPVQTCTPESISMLTPAYLELDHRAHYDGIEDKRRMIRLALDFLRQTYHPIANHQPLPEHALFGEIAVDHDNCTLCMSCVSACPQGALLNSNGLPQLNFLEINCVQCSLCETTCPESAISLNPRYLYDSDLAQTPRRLHEDEVVACVQCGEPYIGSQMLASMFTKMADHPMYQGSQRSLLQMCSDCRVIALHSKQIHKH
ncbi:MAG TPA: 4Fe-4S dicluster domain-containing protein [Crenotrichaceae bacterium]|nr:4Fe-4S dicluster domain-containing protein [Crenotrichaceae bacterium]